LGLTVEVGPLLDASSTSPCPNAACWCRPKVAVRKRLAGWRIALSPRLWARSGYARVVRAWAAKSQKDRPGF
jgi:hypothetical protein